MSEMCATLHRLCGGMTIFSFSFDQTMIPLNGIYVLFEDGEKAHGASRIVRVGTHTGDSQLRSRLEQHFTNPNKDRSIFRKNIGRALLNRDHDPFLAQWDLDLTSSEAKRRYGPALDREKQSTVEQRVSDYIRRSFHFVVFSVEYKETRLDLEAKMISTVSICQECVPSKDWLGFHSPKDRIRESGLWLVNKLYGEQLSDADLAILEAARRPEASR
jgi:hypothetical protein